MIAPEAALEARRHAERCAPAESIGFVVDGRYRPQKNLSPDPETHFRVEPGVVLEALRGGGIEAVIHSHPPPHPPCPSYADQLMQHNYGVPFAIVPVGGDGNAGDLVWWGPGVPRPALVGRPYRWGVTDCYGLVRDWYAEHGVDLPDFPRAWQFWTHGEPLIERHLDDAGFVGISPGLAGVGDGVLIAFGTRRISHCAVIVEPGVILHHPCSDRPYDPRQLSRREPLSRWTPHVRAAVRQPDLKLEYAA